MMNRINVLIEQEQLYKRVDELAKQISEDYKGQEIILVCILKGAAYFAIDLSKKIEDASVIMDFMKVSSYGSSKETSGKINFELDISQNIENKNVIIIEDIIDSGITLNYLYDYLKLKNPKSLKICVLLNKKERRVQDIDVDYVGFDVANKFIVGYGLDDDEKYRNLPFIGYIE